MQEIKEGRENARIYGEPRIKFPEKKGERWERYEERQDDDKDSEAVRARERNWKQERRRKRGESSKMTNLEERERGNDGIDEFGRGKERELV